MIGRANQTLEAIKSLASEAQIKLPVEQFVQFGPAVVSCPSVIVSITSLGNAINVPAQAPYQQVSLVAVIAREYNGANEDGSNNVQAITAANTAAAADGELLWGAAFIMEIAPEDVSISWTIEGGLIMTTATFALPVGVEA